MSTFGRVTAMLIACLVAVQMVLPGLAWGNSVSDFRGQRLEVILQALVIPEPTDFQAALWSKQLAARVAVCPTVHELSAARQKLARKVLNPVYRQELLERLRRETKLTTLVEPAQGGLGIVPLSPSETYIVARGLHAQESLARCRFQEEWAASILKQTPGGRAYLARVADLQIRMILGNSVADYIATHPGEFRVDRIDLFAVAVYASSLVVTVSLIQVMLSLNMINSQLGRSMQAVLAAKAAAATAISGLIEMAARSGSDKESRDGVAGDR